LADNNPEIKSSFTGKSRKDLIVSCGKKGKIIKISTYKSLISF